MLIHSVAKTMIFFNTLSRGVTRAARAVQVCSMFDPVPFGVYIHIPFCRQRCAYCDFSFVVRRVPPRERFVDALLKELHQAAPLQPADSVYFGGGTPSLLDPNQLKRILDAIPRAPGCVVSLEANPEDRTSFARLAQLGFQRISLGVQSFDDHTLRTLGRRHSGAEAHAAVEAALQAGFDSVNADIIFGVPGLNDASLVAQVRQLADLGVHHISAYGLTVHEHTPLAKAARQGRFVPMDDEPERRQFLTLHETLEARGFEHYEISNYARPGHRSFHNELYWLGHSYRGFGPSAHSFDAVQNRRFWNERTFDRWLTCVEAGSTAIAGEEILSPAQRGIERLYLGLRRSHGLHLAEIAGSQQPAFQSRLLQYAKAGWLREHNGYLSLTPAGMALADAVVEGLVAVLPA